MNGILDLSEVDQRITAAGTYDNYEHKKFSKQRRRSSSNSVIATEEPCDGATVRAKRFKCTPQPTPTTDVGEMAQTLRSDLEWRSAMVQQQLAYEAALQNKLNSLNVAQYGAHASALFPAPKKITQPTAVTTQPTADADGEVGADSTTLCPFEGVENSWQHMLFLIRNTQRRVARL